MKKLKLRKIILAKKELLNEKSQGDIKNFSSPFTTSLKGGEAGVGIKIKGKTYKMTLDSAVNLANQLKIIAKKGLK